MTDVVHYDKQDTIAVISVDNPPVNVMSQAVRQQLTDAIKQAEKDNAINAIVLRCDGRTFIAGADIKEFDKPIQDPHLIEVINTLENSGKLTLAAIHGTTLGGGVEIILGCDYRCAAPNTKLGLPEVTLGIIPGANGTQRLPRLVGVETALEMITTGKAVMVDRALETGLIDKIIEADLATGAISYARQLLIERAPKRRVSTLEINKDSFTDGIFDEYRTTLKKRLRNQNAPLCAVDAIQTATQTSFDEGVITEQKLANQCLNSTESAAMRHLFFANRNVEKIPGINKDISTRDIKKVAMIGAGTMGGGIGMNFCNAGIPVVLLDTSQQALDHGLSVIRNNYERSQKKGRLSAQQLEQRMGLITTTLDYNDLADADLVIEAVFEDMQLKREIFSKLDEVCKPGAILATNTSTLDINEIADSISRPQDVIGLHFFSPANVMRLLEIVRCDKTAKDVITTALRMAKTIKKVGVVSGVCYGFIGNRMMEGYGREANMLLLEGARPEDVDRALFDFGMAMGPIAMYDMAGNDVGYNIHHASPELFPDDERYYRITHMAAKMNRLGQKTGAGVYRYEAGSRKPLPDAEMQGLIEAESERLGIKRRNISDEEIVQRCIYPLINEAARILAEGIALRPGDIDIVWTNGYGFPVYRGGPMFYADTIDLTKVYETICKFGNELGNEHGYWTPAPLLKALAESDKSFAEWSDSSS